MDLKNCFILFHLMEQLVYDDFSQANFIGKVKCFLKYMEIRKQT